MSAEARAALKSIDLHFHDLRREAGSRWMDAGVPLATIQRWLGHENAAQTSTYLSGSVEQERAAMARFDAHQDAVQRLATEARKGDQTKLRSTKRRARPASKTMGDHRAAVM